MKAIDLSTSSPSLTEVLDLAGEDNVILKTPEGRQFVLAEIDDFADEVARTARNGSLGELLRARSQEKEVLSLRQVREQLNADKKRRQKGSRRSGDDS